MPAYLIADETITNPEVFEEYKRQVLPTISRFGGRFLARGASYELLETQRPWQPDRLVIIEFPDMDALRRWYQSPEYQPIRKIRHAAARNTLVAIEAGTAAHHDTASAPVGPSLT